MIGQETIDRVRQQTAIVALIGETVKLTKRGRSYTGLCPFHKEKTPSFHVNEERGFYHCFGCGVSGDAFRFVQETQGLGFYEAVRSLAERAGIEVVEDRSESERRQHAEARRRMQELYEINTAAAAYFERMLREHPLAGSAQAELERRGLGRDGETGPVADALQAFRVGYAPYGWDGLTSHLKSIGANPAAAEKIGLLVARKSGSGHYDRFRHRLMFAVVDVQGRVVAFSGRALDEPDAAALARARVEAVPPSEGAGKYVNSPESAIYKKRDTVFGLYQAREAMRSSDECVVVEGNFDVVGLHARGITNVVAPLGTAFTAEQARIIKRFAPNVVLLFDGDAAGRRATAAARGPCLEAGLVARVAELPQGADPDDFVRNAGAQALRNVINAATGMLEYLIDKALDSTFSATDAHAQAQQLKALAELVGSDEDPTVRTLAQQHARRRLAGRLAAADPTILRAIERALSIKLEQSPAPSPGQRAEPPARARSRERQADVGVEIFGAILDYPELLDTPEVENGVQHLEGDLAASIAALRQCVASGRIAALEQLLAKLPPSIHSFAAARLAAPRHVRLEDARTELLGNVEKLKRLETKRQRSQVIDDLERAAKAGDFDRELLLLREHERRARARHGLGER